MFLPSTSLVSYLGLFLLTYSVKMNRVNMDSFTCTSHFIYKSSEVSSMHTFTPDQAFMKESSLGKSLWLSFACEVCVSSGCMAV